MTICLKLPLHFKKDTFSVNINTFDLSFSNLYSFNLFLFLLHWLSNNMLSWYRRLPPVFRIASMVAPWLSFAVVSVVMLLSPFMALFLYVLFVFHSIMAELFITLSVKLSCLWWASILCLWFLLYWFGSLSL